MIEVSERAARRIADVVSEHEGQYSGLRVGLQDGGCSGYTYLLEFEGSPDQEDQVIAVDGAKVFVHPLHAPF